MAPDPCLQLLYSVSFELSKCSVQNAAEQFTGHAVFQFSLMARVQGDTQSEAGVQTALHLWPESQTRTFAGPECDHLLVPGQS